MKHSRSGKRNAINFSSGQKIEKEKDQDSGKYAKDPYPLGGPFTWHLIGRKKWIWRSSCISASFDPTHWSEKRVARGSRVLGTGSAGRHFLTGSRRMIELATAPLLYLNTTCPFLPLQIFSFSQEFTVRDVFLQKCLENSR